MASEKLDAIVLTGGTSLTYFSGARWGTSERLMALVLPVLCLLRDISWKYAKRMYYPQAYHHIQEIQKYNIQDYRPRYAFQN